MSPSSDARTVAEQLLAPLGFRVRSVSHLQTLWAGYGQICGVKAELVKGKANGGVHKFVLKLIAPPADQDDDEDEDEDEGHIRKMLSYAVEQHFYTRVAPHLPAQVHLAACVAATPASPAGYRPPALPGLTATLLSDLRPSFPIAGERRGALDTPHVRAALRWLAGLHGAVWSMPPGLRAQLSSPHKGLVRPPLEEGNHARDGRTLWLNGGYTYLATRLSEYASLQSDRRSEWNVFCVPDSNLGGSSVAEAVARVLAPRGRDEESIIHGDVKSENLFARGHGEDDDDAQVAFFDFQYVGLGLGACDLAKLFTCSIPPSMLGDDAPPKGASRGARAPRGMTLPMGSGERSLLQQYHSDLVSSPNAPTYEWDTFVRHWETALVDWCRFQASWGFWGNTAWLSARVRHVLADEGWRAWLMKEDEAARKGL